MRTFLGVLIAVLVLAAAVLVSLSMIPPPAEEIPPNAVRVSSNGTVTVIVPRAISLATKWRAGPVDGLHISEDVSSAAVLPNYPYLHRHRRTAWNVSVSGMADYDRRREHCPWEDSAEYLLSPELLDITFQETLVTPSAPSPPSSQTATPTPVS